MDKIIVDLKEDSYPIYIHDDFGCFEEVLSRTGNYKKVFIVTDDNGERLILPDLMASMDTKGRRVFTFSFPPGEENKNHKTLNTIYEFLISSSIDRSCLIIALGGGVVGDMAGFAAATILRGVDLIQVPTTLLSQADSSVGGKTAIDFHGYKNIVGAFKQPKAVYINVGTLKTLDLRQMRSGFMETVKHALIGDEDFFEYLDKNMDKVFSKDLDTLKYLARTNCTIKSRVVSRDEKEGGLREILNFGHTVGHGVESASSFSLTHGESVALGTVAAMDLSIKLGYTTLDVKDRVTGLLKRAGLPVLLGEALLEADRKAIFNNIFMDKKIRNDRIKFIVLKNIGSVSRITMENAHPLREIIEGM